MTGAISIRRIWSWEKFEIYVDRKVHSCAVCEETRHAWNKKAGGIELNQAINILTAVVRKETSFMNGRRTPFN